MLMDTFLSLRLAARTNTQEKHSGKSSDEKRISSPLLPRYVLPHEKLKTNYDVNARAVDYIAINGKIDLNDEHVLIFHE